MQMMPSLQVKQKQALVMTPQLQQAIKLLQMTNLDIANFLQEQAMENPFIEVENGTDHTPRPILAWRRAPRRQRRWLPRTLTARPLIWTATWPQVAPYPMTRHRMPMSRTGWLGRS